MLCLYICTSSTRLQLLICFYLIVFDRTISNITDHKFRILNRKWSVQDIKQPTLETAIKYITFEMFNKETNRTFEHIFEVQAFSQTPEIQVKQINSFEQDADIKASY